MRVVNGPGIIMDMIGRPPMMVMVSVGRSEDVLDSFWRWSLCRVVMMRRSYE